MEEAERRGVYCRSTVECHARRSKEEGKENQDGLDSNCSGCRNALKYQSPREREVVARMDIQTRVIINQYMQKTPVDKFVREECHGGFHFFAQY